MSDPLSEHCLYCGSPDVMDDAWWCEKLECWKAYEADMKAAYEYEQRTPLTRNWAERDLWYWRAPVWGHYYGRILRGADRLRLTILR